MINDTEFCPLERNVLNDFYELAKGQEWTVSTNWTDPIIDHCTWFGVTCNDFGDGNVFVTNLTLHNNGLSGRLDPSIAELKYLEILDLSDNDIKVSLWLLVSIHTICRIVS